MAEWTLKFIDNSFFRLCQNLYYIKNGKGIGLKEVDYCYFSGNSLDFIECKKVKNIKDTMIDCSLKGIHSLAIVKTGLLENNEQFLSGLNELSIPKDIKINVYFIFKTNYEEESQILSIFPSIEKNINCFKSIWNINEIQVLTFEKAKSKLNYIIDEEYI